VKGHSLALNHLLHALRLGLCVMYLRQCDAHANKEITEILTLLTRATDIGTLLQRIAILIESRLPVTDELSRQYVDRLVDLYCALRDQKMEPDDDQ
ncbi:FUSC family protein, partial [Dickeya oryzae]|nr:FUSC family protein [Dickeya oryzae]